jgi:hypothetical protein
LLVTALAIATAPVLAAEPSGTTVEPTAYPHVVRTVKSAAAAPSDSHVTSTVAGAGLKVFLDRNGKPATPPQGQSISSKLTQTTRPVSGPEVPLPEGGYKTKLGEKFMMMSVAKIRPDGRVRVECAPATTTAVTGRKGAVR